MERALLHHHHHRLYNSSSHPSSTAALRPLHFSALSPSFLPTHRPALIRLLLPCRFPPRASFGSFFLTSLPFLPFPLIPRCPKHSHLPIACISSSVFAAGAGGGGIGPGGGAGGGGGGHGGGDGFVARGTGTQALGPESDDIPLASSIEDFIFLDVGVNVDALKLTVDSLKSVNKERDPEEMQIYAELFRELEEIDLRVSPTRRGRARGRGRTSTTHSSTHVRRGSGSSSVVAVIEEDDFVTDLREPEYDEEGNVLSEGDYGMISSLEASSEDTASPMHSDTSKDNSEDAST